MLVVLIAHIAAWSDLNLSRTQYESIVNQRMRRGRVAANEQRGDASWERQPRGSGQG